MKTLLHNTQSSNRLNIRDFQKNYPLWYILTLTCRLLCSDHYSDHFKRERKQTHQQEKKG